MQPVRHLRNVRPLLRGATTIARRATSTASVASHQHLSSSKDTCKDELSRRKHVPDTSFAVEQPRLEVEATPETRYRELVDQGVLRSDPHQQSIIDKLQRLHDQLKTYNPPLITPPTPPSIFDKLFNRVSTTPTPILPPPKGLYLYGDVGTGKSMLMDLFYDTLPPNIRRKRRAHFHAYMIDVHKRIHAVKARAGHEGLEDPILPVARDLANEAGVLCFDEFQVTDIADAMILRRLFECLHQFGVVCVMTSNRHPDDLYKNGIQRSSFIPCIEHIKATFDVTDLDSGTDYRRIPRALSKVYFHPIDASTEAEIDKLFHALAGSHPIEYNRPLTIWGRTLNIPVSAGRIAKFTFDELCGSPLSAPDYIEVTRQFRTVFLVGVKSMGVEEKDLARRFITFIDACYENKTKLFTTSDVPIHQVFSSEKDTGSQELSHHQRSIMDDLGISSDVIGTSYLFSGEEEIFAFARACSRLVQMGTKEWAMTAGED